MIGSPSEAGFIAFIAANLRLKASVSVLRLIKARVHTRSKSNEKWPEGPFAHLNTQLHCGIHFLCFPV